MTEKFKQSIKQTTLAATLLINIKLFQYLQLFYRKWNIFNFNKKTKGQLINVNALRSINNYTYSIYLFHNNEYCNNKIQI